MRPQFENLINQILPFSKKEMDAFWALGEIVEIPANTFLDTTECLLNSLFYLHEGITRDYFSDVEEIEYISKFNCAPDVMARGILTQKTGIQSEIFGSAITPLVGMKWSFATMEAFAVKVPRVYKLLALQTLHVLDRKEQADRRRNELNLKEQYESFMLVYPGLINQIPLKYISSYLRIRPETLSRIRVEIMNH